MPRLLLVSLGLLLAFGAPAQSSIIFPDFSSTTGLTLSGSATTTVTSDGAVLRLVPAMGFQAGSAFSLTPINLTNFSSFFSFRLTNPEGPEGSEVDIGGEGFVFVVQPFSSSLGGPGGGLGYAGVSPSVGVEFDTFRNAWDPSAGSNHLGVDLNGSVASLVTVNTLPNFDDGNRWFAWVDYGLTTLEVRVNQTGIRPEIPVISIQGINIAAMFGSNTAFVGFSAATGAAWENVDIISWQYSDDFNPIVTPEPSTLVLLGSGLVALTAAVRRRSRSHQTECATAADRAASADP